jgi:ABC-2 type transport system ATP-binding protein
VETIRRQPFVTSLRELGNNGYQAVVTNGEAAVPALFDALSSHPAHIGAISYERPSLDDVFLHYTGRELRETGGGEEAIRARMVMRRTRG